MTAPSAESAAEADKARSALTVGAVAFVFWGFMPLLFQAIHRLGVGPWETLSQRILWGVPTALVFVLLAGQGRQALSVLRRPRVLAWLTLSACLIAMNWIFFIAAVTHGRVLEASLGYYINPLCNMAAGALMFRERIDRIGLAAIGLAVVGVAVQALALGQVPLATVALALTFTGYSVVRKQVDADAQTGLLVECLVLSAPSLAFVAWMHGHGGGHFLDGPVTALWLMAAGPATAAPLMMFSWAARRAPLSSLAFIQFISPTMGFVIGLAQGETFTAMRAVSFVFIWIGAAVFLYGAWRRARSLRAIGRGQFLSPR